MFRLVFILLISFVSWNHAKNVTVSVYYESLCSDSVDFFKNQLQPTLIALKQNMKMDLIPFGKASFTKSGGKWNFTCQHGAAECYGNKVHACAIDLAPESNSTEFVMCAMKSGNASDVENLKECAMDNSVNWTDIEKCLDSGKGDELLVRNGKRTKDVNPKITFIPTIIFNNNYREALQKIALSNFLEIVEFLVEEIECERCRTRSGGTELYLTSFSVVLVFLPLIKIF